MKNDKIWDRLIDLEYKVEVAEAWSNFFKELLLMLGLVLVGVYIGCRIAG